MSNRQRCIELISTTIAEIMEDAVLDALRVHQPARASEAAGLEQTGADIAALARTLQILRRTEDPIG